MAAAKVSVGRGPRGALVHVLGWCNRERKQKGARGGCSTLQQREEGGSRPSWATQAAIAGPRARGPDLAAETLPAGPSHLAGTGSGCLAGARRAEPRPVKRSGRDGVLGWERALGQQVPSATPARSCS